MGKEQTLKPQPINRTINTLKLFKKLIDAHRVNQVIAIATAAVRKAKNKDFFIKKVKETTNIDLQIASGEKEAYYAYLGVINTIDIDNCLIIDIGGASTELIWVQNRMLKECISLPYGAVVITEIFLKSDPVTANEISKLEKFLKNRLKSIPWLKKAYQLPIVGLGGTIRALAKIDRKFIQFPLVSLHNYRLLPQRIFAIWDELAHLNISERKKVPGLNKERADIILGGLAIIRSLQELINSEELIVSGNGLREGLFFREYYKLINFPEEVNNNILEHSVDNILKNYDANIKHCKHVQKLALSLFEQTHELHGLGSWQKKILLVSSLLHDIGIYVYYYNHHKHGFYLVQNSKINGLSNKELLMCAFVIGMHRDNSFKKNWKDYKLLISKEDIHSIRKLSLFIRIAENLDRNESEDIYELKCQLSQDKVIIEVVADTVPELEISAAMKSEKEFFQLFEKQLLITKQ